MSDPYGIIDLSALKRPAGGTGATDAGEPSAHEVAVTEQGLERLIADSQQIPTLLLVTSGRVSEGPTYLAALRRGVDAKGGARALAVVDADTQRRVAAALRVQQLPTLLLLLAQGQLRPIVDSVFARGGDRRPAEPGRRRRPPAGDGAAGRRGRAGRRSRGAAAASAGRGLRGDRAGRPRRRRRRLPQAAPGEPRRRRGEGRPRHRRADAPHPGR
ncbi:hypothetical protein [Brachybacterium sp. GPGPB12]|uniref:hypothetical protein n=1 Tax=Brachybacterium sp. GPGPB12 TaxID=3023517 RepID=UPI0031345916